MSKRRLHEPLTSGHIPSLSVYWYPGRSKVFDRRSSDLNLSMGLIIRSNLPRRQVLSRFYRLHSFEGLRATQAEDPRAASVVITSENVSDNARIRSNIHILCTPSAVQPRTGRKNRAWEAGQG